MSEHSPGPWRVGGDCRLGERGEPAWVELDTGRGIWGADGEPIVGLRDWFVASDLDLISAAPDLLAALREAVDWLNPYRGAFEGAFYDRCRALIARIEGGK